MLVREAIPGRSIQVRGWMTRAALANYLLGRPYWVWTPHALYRRLLHEPNACRVAVSAVPSYDVAEMGTAASRLVGTCDECSQPDAPKRGKGAVKPFCMKCGRDFEPAMSAPRSRFHGD